MFLVNIDAKEVNGDPRNKLIHIQSTNIQQGNKEN